MTDDKMDTRDIADFLRRSRAYVTDTLTKSPDFPRPIIDRGRQMRFWRRADVETWAGYRREAMSSNKIETV